LVFQKGEGGRTDARRRAHVLAKRCTLPVTSKKEKRNRKKERETQTELWRPRSKKVEGTIQRGRKFGVLPIKTTHSVWNSPVATSSGKTGIKKKTWSQGKKIGFL